ncbi:MAG: TIGR00180 family glycosyltransferase, partial [Leptospiraceae bacterium]|nr:TIGR00180 family glycosyltransferase [Leptospiraceae bacterium]
MSFSLSIVIPTYNRQNYVLRNMKFWSNKNVLVYVLDGSADSIEKNKLEGLGENINYFHLPITFPERVKKSLELVKTKYTVFMGDDEFYFPSGLKQCIDELEKNEDLVACSGRCLGFQYKNKILSSWFMYNNQKNYSISSNDPIERMKYHMENYTPSTVYGVTRTEDWKNSWRSFTEKEFPIFSMAEIQLELSLSFFGKSKVIPVLTWFRSYENETVLTGEGSFSRENVFENWWNKTEKIEEINEFLDIMSETLFKQNKFNLSKEEIIKGIKESLDKYYKLILTIQNKKKKNKKFILKISPSFFKKIMKQIFSSLGIIH